MLKIPLFAIFRDSGSNEGKFPYLSSHCSILQCQNQTLRFLSMKPKSPLLLCANVRFFDFHFLVCHDDLVTSSVSYLGDVKLIMKSRDTVQIIQNKLKSKSSMQFEKFSTQNGKFDAKGQFFFYERKSLFFLKNGDTQLRSDFCSVISKKN